jgi:diacylglycerol kinase (ATP)
MDKRVKLIFNPHASRGRAWEIATMLQSIVERYGGGEWAATEYPTHATELAIQAAKEGFDVIAALGGDGTVHEVVNGLMTLPAESRPILGAVPIGSGNDFCNNNGISNDVELAMQRVYQGEPRPIDIGQIIDGSGRTEYIDNTIGIGFDATVTIYSYEVTRLRGFSMYLWCVIQTIIRNHDAPRMTLRFDDDEFEQEVLMLVLCNGPREGGGFHVAPDAVSDDGYFDYAMIGKVSRPMMFRLLPEVMKGTHGRFKPVKIGRFKDFSLKSEKPLIIHIDGEVYAGFTSDVTELDFVLHPGALRVIT